MTIHSNLNFCRNTIDRSGRQMNTISTHLITCPQNFETFIVSIIHKAGIAEGRGPLY